MANDLTGDFDVLVEFADPAVNRGVRPRDDRNERFPHYAAFHVDDRSGLPAGNNVVVAVVDTFANRRAGRQSPPARATRPVAWRARDHQLGLRHARSGGSSTCW